MLAELIARFEQKRATVGIVGLGYFWLPPMRRFGEVGLGPLGFDLDEHKVGSLNERLSYIEHVADQSIARVRAAGFSATTEFSRADEAWNKCSTIAPRTATATYDGAAWALIGSRTSFRRSRIRIRKLRGFRIGNTLRV